MQLSNAELLNALKYGIKTKLKEAEDKELTHYNVLDFTDDELLICFSGIDWRDGTTWYAPHVVKISEKDKTWFLACPKKISDELDDLTNTEIRLGISLITLGKMLLQGDVYVKGVGFVKFHIADDSLYYIGNYGDIVSLNLKDYGRTFARTKEELL